MRDSRHRHPLLALVAAVPMCIETSSVVSTLTTTTTTTRTTTGGG